MSSLPRTLNALRFTSLLSFFISCFIVVVIFTLCFKNKSVPDLDPFNDRFKKAYDESGDISLDGVFNSIPLIIFSYMYQPLIPAIYHELSEKNIKNMNTVLGLGTAITAVIYIVVGIFGWVTFTKNEFYTEIMEKQNILIADEYNGYGNNKVMKACGFLILFVVLFASPFCVLPSKDSVEELMFGKQKKKFTVTQNFICTLCLIAVSWGIAILVPTIGDAMTILGATTNSWIGFLIPIVFYSKIESRDGKSNFTATKSVSYLIFLLICVCSCITLYTYATSKT